MVLVVRNNAMAPLSRLDLVFFNRALCLYVVLDYFDSKKLHQITNYTMLNITLY